MIQIKIFYSISYSQLQSEVSEWLKNTPIVEVVKMAQTETDETITLTLLYR